MATKACAERVAEIRPLSMDEIDQRIDSLITEVMVPPGELEEAGPHEPRWISAAELVQRMRPFLVLN